jgi:hypothetical protein
MAARLKPSACVLALQAVVACSLTEHAGGEPAAPRAGWICLSRCNAFAHWQGDHHGWRIAGDAALDPMQPERLVAEAGTGVIISDGEAADLLSACCFRDVELSCEFIIPRNSNSGVKLNALYEVQISDTHAMGTPQGDSCGGIYPRAELEPEYRLLDAGTPPRVNAALPAGQWQTLELRFHSPRFNFAGRKIANARVERVVLNGKLIHDRVELKYPTGHAWRTKPETPVGPVMLQGDHGPVAFRNVRVRPLATPASRQ